MTTDNAMKTGPNIPKHFVINRATWRRGEGLREEKKWEARGCVTVEAICAVWAISAYSAASKNRQSGSPCLEVCHTTTEFCCEDF